MKEKSKFNAMISINDYDKVKTIPIQPILRGNQSLLISHKKPLPILLLMMLVSGGFFKNQVHMAASDNIILAAMNAICIQTHDNNYYNHSKCFRFHQPH